MDGSLFFNDVHSNPFSEENVTGGLLGQAQMHIANARDSSPEDNLATDPRFLTPKKQTRVKKEKIKEDDDDEYIDEPLTPPPSSKKRRRVKSEPTDHEAQSPSKVVKSTPTKGGRRAAATAIGRREIEMLFDHLSTRLPSQEWQTIVNEMNKKFGTNRRADNVRTHWNAVSRKKLVSAYGGPEGNGKD